MLGHGAPRVYRLYGPRMSPIDNFSLVTGSKLQAYDSRIKIGSMRVQVQTFRGIFRLKRPPLRTLIGCKGNEGNTGKEKWIVTGARIGYDVWGGLSPGHGERRSASL